MTKFISRWHKSNRYESLLWFESETFAGVSFSLRQVSLKQRLELNAKVRELTLRNEFLRAGEIRDKLEAAAADLLVEKLYVEWAVERIEGLRIDGQAATVATLIQSGPEVLVHEIFDAIRTHLELTETERKNF